MGGLAADALKNALHSPGAVNIESLHYSRGSGAASCITVRCNDPLRDGLHVRDQV
jgi:hypothetical protein